MSDEYTPQNSQQTPPQSNFPTLQTSPKRSNKKIWIFVGVSIIIILLVLVFFFVKPLNNWIGSKEKQGSEIIACANWDCFISALSDCSLANFTNAETINVFGIDTTTITYYELKGIQEDKCNFYLRIAGNEVSYSNELIQQLLDGGLTQEEINQQEELSGEQITSLIGRDGTCEVDLDVITNYFSKLKEGTLLVDVSCDTELGGETICTYSGDTEFFNECEGDYFNTQL